MIVLFLAWFLQTRIHTIDDFKETILPAVIPPLVFIALILKEPDLGTALVCAAVMMLMLFLAGMQVKWLLVGGGGCVAGAVLHAVPCGVASERACWCFCIRRPIRGARGFIFCSR